MFSLRFPISSKSPRHIAAFPTQSQKPTALNNLKSDLQPDQKTPRKSVVSGYRQQKHAVRKPYVTDWKEVNSSQELSYLLDSFRPDLDCGEPIKAVFTEIAIAQYQFKLYAIENPLPSQPQDSPSASNLLLVLIPIADSYVPVGTDLTIQEAERVVAYQNRCWSTNPAYLYTLITGSWQQQFTVEVVLPNVLPFALPPLMFTQP